jgi:hypothetical protein
VPQTLAEVDCHPPEKTRQPLTVINLKVSGMELKLDAEQFDTHQAIFIREIVEKIRIKIQEAGLQGEALQTLTANIAFSIASTIDDTSGIEADGIAVKPYLTFRTSENAITHCGENSFTYEHVFGILRDLFED